MQSVTMITEMARIPPFRNVVYRNNKDKATSNVKYEGSFTMHGSEVWYCSIHPTLNMALSGSSNGKVFIWDLDNKSIYFKNQKAALAIMGLEFSKDGDFFFICCHPRLMEVYSFKIDGAVVSAFKLRDVILEKDAVWVKWHTTTNTLYCGCDDGRVHYWKVPQIIPNSLKGSPSACNVVDMTKDGVRMIVGHNNGLIRLWNLPNYSIELEILPHMGLNERAHRVCAQLNTTLFVATSNRKVLVFTARVALWTVIFPQDIIISCIASPIEGRSPIMAIGTANNKLIIMNIMSKDIAEAIKLNPKYGSITAVRWLSREVVGVSTITGDVYVVNAKTCVLQFSVHGHHECLVGFESRVSDKRIITVSTDGSLNVYKHKSWTISRQAFVL